MLCLVDIIGSSWCRHVPGSESLSMICRWWFASLWNCLCRQWHSLELTILTWNGAPIMLIRAKIRAKIRTKKWIIMWLQHPSINSPHTFQVSRWHITIPTTINFYKSWFCHHIMDHDNDLQLEEEEKLLQKALARIQAHRKANKVASISASTLHDPATLNNPASPGIYSFKLFN